MAEARSEDDEENMMRDAREQVSRRPQNCSGGRPERRKPEQRHSHGPLSSIRAAIKRTSNRSTSSSEAPRERDRDRDRDRERDRERDRDRDRDRERDRRRPEITILSAEPLASASWFPGAAGGFPPPPPPAAQIWGGSIPPPSTFQPPPSYDDVIREKTEEQRLRPSSSSSSTRCSSSLPSIATTTIATQTDTGSNSDLPPPPPPLDDRKSCVVRPERPSRPPVLRPSLLPRSRPPQSDSTTQSCDLLAELCPPATSAEAPPAASERPRPRPRPRSRLSAGRDGNDVKVQTLVKLREDGVATLAARDAARSESSQGPYLQELLDAFSSDQWGVPERRRSSSSSSSQSESEEEEEDDDMAALKARIQAFEQQQQQQQQVSDGTSGVEAKRPEPRPRPRLQPAKSAPPTIAPKPKSFSGGAKPSSQLLCKEDGGAAAAAAADSEPPPSDPSKDTESPAPLPAPIPAPRPPPPRLASPAEPPSAQKPPPRPPVAPRASTGPPPQERSTVNRHSTPSLPPRPSVEPEPVTGNAPSVKAAVRPNVPSKPAALLSPRRASAPTLTPKPSEPSPAPPKPAAAAAHKPPVQTKPPSPAPSLRRSSAAPPKAESSAPANGSDPPLPPRPSGVKLLPLRPPPMKSTPGRPPPPAITSSASQVAPPPPTTTTTTSSSSSQVAPPPPTTTASSSSQVAPPPDTPLSAAANQTQAQKAMKKGPPLPPRPKPGHPLYNSYMKQEVLIVLDDPAPPPASAQPTEPPPDEGRSQSTPVPPSQCLLDLDPPLGPLPSQEDQSKAALEEGDLSRSQSILPAQPPDQKEQPEAPPISGPRCLATFDYEGEEEDELTFSQGDVIALLELVGTEWGRGRIHGRAGIFPLGFTQVLEPLPPAAAPDNDGGGDKAEEWAVALFDFPGQTAEDLCFQKGALIRVTEHIDAEWRRGLLDGREGLYPAAFTQSCQAQPITGQQSVAKDVAKALFDFTAESEEELTLKAGDVITQVEAVDEQWILGVVGGKRGIVPKNYISFL